MQVARIRAIESRLLRQEEVERMLYAKNAQDAFKILNDLDWAEFLAEIKKVEDFPLLIDAGLLEVKKTICEMLDNENDFDFLWLLFDLENACLLTKAFLKNEDPENLREVLSPLGCLSKGKIKQIIFEKKEIEGFSWLIEKVEQIKKEFKKKENPEIIDFLLQEEFFARILAKVKKTYSSMMISFFERMIDIENLKAFLRRKEKEFLSGGKISLEILSSAKDLNELLEKIDEHKIMSLIEAQEGKNDFIDILKVKEELIQILQMLQEETACKTGINFLKIEKELDEFLFSTLNPSILEPFNIEPIFAFFWIKKRNAEIIRTILVGKLNGIEEKEIRKWIKKPALKLF